MIFARLVALAWLLAASPAAAQPEQFSLVGIGGVIVWLSDLAEEAGSRLLVAGQPDLAAKYAACVAPTGSRAIAMPGSNPRAGTVRVTVIDGERRGCEGNVHARDLLRASGKTLQQDREESVKARRDAMEQSERERQAIFRRRDAEIACQLASLGSPGKIADKVDACMAERGFPPTASPRP